MLLQAEDRGPDRVDRGVQIVDQARELVRLSGFLDAHADALQAQTDREDPLDHQVVQVAGDPVAVFEHRQALPVGGLPAELHSQRGMPGEGLDHLHVGLGVRLFFGAAGDGENADHRVTGH